MFDHKKQAQAIEALDARMKAVEENVHRLVEELSEKLPVAIEQHMDALRREVEADPNARLRVLLDAASADVRRAVETALEDARRVSAARAEVETAAAGVRNLDARLSGVGLGPPRDLDVGVVYEAEATGYVTVWFYSGSSSVVRLLQGPTSPPEVVVAHYSAAHGGCGGMVVRKGEYWAVQAGGDVHCAFTPFL